MKTENKKNVVEKIVDDLKESTRAVHEINKANMAAVKADSKANFEEATTPNPDFVEFKEAKGIKNKAKVVVKNIKEGAKANSEKEKAHREELKHHESYKNLLVEQREARQSTIHKNK